MNRLLVALVAPLRGGFLLGILGLLVASSSACTTPDHWSAQDHRELMMQCRVSCADSQMASYDAWTAKCVCRVGDRRGRHG